MREYELTVVYDLAVAEAGGPEAGPQRLTSFIESRGGEVLKVDHWGRRRMAYPINRAIDGDYIISRINLEPGSVAALEAAFMIDERVYRHLVVRADELPPPPPPREPREPRPMAASEAPAASEASAVTETAAETPPAEAPGTEEPEAEEPVAEAAVAEADEPLAEAPVAEAEEPVAEAPVAEAEAPTIEEPVAEAAPDAVEPPASEEPTAPETVAEEPAEE